MLCFCFFRAFAPTFHFKLLKDQKYLAPPEIFSLPPRLCWTGYGPDQDTQCNCQSCSSWQFTETMQEFSDAKTELGTLYPAAENKQCKSMVSLNPNSQPL